ncbi:phosphoribosylanthranilate isomerase [Desulfococcus sp.]|uniref:phosphoribosylanthranilate isomerase n=1 Tax=Desulfococcus sp. TaxID=2025834 RepID=UPI003593FB4D
MAHPPFPTPQVKVCGLTDVDQAVAVARLGVHAIGCVFFPKSPRHLTRAKARAICAALPASVRRVGVFVDEAFESIMGTVHACGLDAVQLHGHEPPELVLRLRGEGLIVIKALFLRRAPGLADADAYRPSAFLVECGAGKLPGGNAEAWAWAEARSLGDRRPLVLAGGLGPENVLQAVEQAQPDAVDLSSGVEASPGTKDLKKVAALMAAVRRCRMERAPRTIF